MALRVSNLTAVLPGDTGMVRVLDGVSFQVAPGDALDVVGPSGSGKTTLLRAVALLLPGATGELSLGNASSSSVDPRVWRSRVALLPQKPAIIPGTVRDNLLVPWRLKVREGTALPSESHLAERLEAVGIDAELDRDAARLSVGQHARLAFLRVLLTEPDVVLLDEADAALDDASVALVGEATRRFLAGGGAAVRVRHRADDGVANRRMHLEHGRLTEVGA